MFLGCAVDAHVIHIVSGDKDLDELLRGGGVKPRVAKALGLGEASANSTLNKWIRGAALISPR